MILSNIEEPYFLYTSNVDVAANGFLKQLLRFA
jgi:hypothetical protein